jgi:hypothetical protein
MRDWIPSPLDLRVFAGYLVAAAVYIVISIFVPDFMLSFWVGVLYVVAAAWLVPLAIRRIRTR